MIKKVSVAIILFSSLLFANELKEIKEDFSDKLQNEFSEDFAVWEVEFYKANSMIRFSKSDLMYKPGNSKMQKGFKFILNDFYPRYLELLLKYKDNIDEVIIIGHTSSENSKAKTLEGKYLRNLVLSQDRANIALELSLIHI